MHVALSPKIPAFRWILVTAAACLLGIAMGTLVNGLSAFVLPLERHFGWERAAVSAINSVGLVGIALGGIVAGFAADRIATRTICLVGAATLSLMLLLAARAEALWQFYALFFIAGAIGGGALFAPVMALVGKWFQTGAGLAIGIAAAGQGLGQGLIQYLAGHLIEAIGWQDAFTLLGAGAAVTLVPLALLMVEPPAAKNVAGGQDGIAKLPMGIVVPALSVAVFGCCLGMAVPLMHLVPLIQEVTGEGAKAGGPLIGMFVAAIAGRVVFGWIADTNGALVAWMIAVLWQTTLVFGFFTLGSMQAFWLFAPIYGFGYGGVMTGVLVSIRAVTPLSHRNSATGIVLAFAWLGHAAGAWQGGLFFDLTGSYLWSYANAVLAGMVNLAIIGTIWTVLRRGH